jgi:hypothetical protein
MTRFAISTCGVLAEVATIDSASPTPAIVLGVVGVVVAMCVWWSEIRPVVDHLVGLDL